MKQLLLASAVIFLVGTRCFAQSPPAVTIEAYDLLGNPLGNNPTVCQFQHVDFYVQLPYENTEPKTFKWKNNGITVFTQTGINPSSPGIGWSTSTLADGDVVSLTVVFTAPPPFYSPDSVTSQGITFSVTSNQPPILLISDNMLNDTICYGNSITFTANPIDAGIPTYQWYLDGSPVGTASTYSTPATLANGSYQVWCEIVSGDFCDTQDPVFNPAVSSNTTNFAIQTCTFNSVQDIGMSAINLSPNPATNEFKIQNSEFKIEKIEMKSVLGEIVFSSQISNFMSQISVDVSQLPSGIYFVKVKGENGESVTKFVKQ